MSFALTLRGIAYGSSIAWILCRNPDWHENFEYRVKENHDEKTTRETLIMHALAFHPEQSSGENRLVYDAEVIVDLIMTSSERSEGQAWEYFWDELAPEYSSFAIFMIPGDIEIILSEWDNA